MAWAIFTTPEDAMEVVSAFSEAGLTGNERNRVRDYGQAFLAGWNANVPVPAEHPCHATDADTMRLVVMNHGTKADWLALVQQLLNRQNRDREILRPYFTFISQSPWYAVDPWPAPAGYFAGMTCT